MEETISQSEPEIQNTDRDLHIKMKFLQPHQLHSTNNPNDQSLYEYQQEAENNPTNLENLYPQTCLKKEEGCDGFKETSKNLEVFFIKFSKNSRRTLLLCRQVMVTKLNSNLILFGAINIFLTYQSDVRSKFSRPQKPDSNIHRAPTNELDCT